MFAARRGRRAPAFLVRTSPPAQPAAESSTEEPTIAERVELLTESPDAFRLAVRLAAGPFTMPIAQLVQSTLFGRDAQHAQVAEMMLSGLVMRVTSADASVPPEQVQFQFLPEAAPRLLQSLRREDAREMTALLQGYIEQNFGTTRDQLVYINDPEGAVEDPSVRAAVREVERALREVAAAVGPARWIGHGADNPESARDSRDSTDRGSRRPSGLRGCRDP